MAEIKHRVELTIEHRDLMLKYGYVSGRLEAELRHWPDSQAIRRVGMTGADLHLLIGDLSYSYNHDKVGIDDEALLTLCEYLESAERTAGGNLNLDW